MANKSITKTIYPATVSGVITPPSSKSYAQRAIAAALLAQGVTTLHGVDMCNDTRSSMAVAQAMGAKISDLGGGSFEICGGLSPCQSTLNIGESGLATRLFTPISALCNCPITITGKGSIMTRPVEMMVAPLRELGVEVTSHDGYLPITVQGPIVGGEIEVDGRVSSQFVTGLLTALPLATTDTTLRVTKLNSLPYIMMTIDLVAKFGVVIEHNNFEEFFIRGGQCYTPIDYRIEGDWSGASCMLVAGAVAGEITLGNLNPLSLQADVAIIDALTMAGAQITSTTDSVTVSKRELNAFEFDATHCPDLFPALAALAASCSGVSAIRGTSRLVHKESDRAETIRSEFGKLGIEVDISEPDVMRITGGQIRRAEVSSHNDHRIAMATAVAALNADGPVTIHDAGAVDKSYPTFWEDFGALTTPIEA